MYHLIDVHKQKNRFSWELPVIFPKKNFLSQKIGKIYETFKVMWVLEFLI